jgi:hypothetical protein
MIKSFASLFTVVVSMLSLSALAQVPLSLEEKARQVAVEIRHEGPFLKVETREAISSRLDEILKLVRGEDLDNKNPLICVSKDNDNRGPYALAFRNGIDVFRIVNAIYSSMEDCQNAITNSRKILGATLVCSAKDRDGRSPYDIGAISGPAPLVKIQRSVTLSMIDCQETLKDMKVFGSQVVFCGSQDSDGRSPFRAVSADIKNGTSRMGTESFPSLEACRTFLGR